MSKDLSKLTDQYFFTLEKKIQKIVQVNSTSKDSMQQHPYLLSQIMFSYYLKARNSIPNNQFIPNNTFIINFIP